MKFHPSEIDRMLAEMPEEMQILALQAIIEEHERFQRGDFTEEEMRVFEYSEACGAAMAETVDEIIVGVLAQK